MSSGVEPKKFIFRIYTGSGRHRVEVDNNISIQRLYKSVAEVCGIDNDFTLYKDSSLESSLSKKSRQNVRTANLSDGQILYIAVDSNITAANTNSSPTSAESSVIEMPSPVLEPVEPAADSPKNPKSSEPKFKSFDGFLKERMYNTVDLPLLNDYKGFELTLGKANSIPPAVTLKHQPYRHIDHVEFVNVQEMSQFVQYWRFELDMLEQRAGWLIGHYVEDIHYSSGIRAVVEGIYEPPQVSTDGSSVSLLDDPFLPIVKSLMNKLDLQIVGYIFTHLPRDELLTASDVITIAKLQLEALKFAPSHYSGYPVSPFVTVTIAVRAHPEDQSVATDAFMVSDLGMAFVRDKLLQEPENGGKIKLKQPIKNHLLPDILESGQKVSEFDPDWLIVRLNDSAPKKATSIFKSWDFPVENRKRYTQPSDITDHFALHKTSESLVPFADLHFILYLAQLFDEDTAGAVCSAVFSQTEVDPLLADTLKML